MKYLKLAYRMFCNSFLLNLSLIIQLVAGFAFINIVICYFANEKITDTLLSPLSDQKYVYFQTDLFNRGFDENKLMSELKSVKSVNKRYTIAMKDESGNVDLFITYDKELLNLIKYPLYKGNYFDTSENDYNFVSAIAVKNNRLNIGDVLPYSTLSKNEKFNIKISGILSEPTYILELSTGGDNVATIDLFNQYDPNLENSLMYICEDSILNKCSEDDKIVSYNSIIFFENDISENDFNYNVMVLSNFGWVADNSELYKNSNEIIKFYFYKIAPYGILTLIIALMGFIGVSILITYKNQKNYAIYFVCGCSIKKCMIINIIYNSMIVLIAIMAFYIYAEFNAVILENIQFRIGKYNIIFLCIFSLASILVGSFIPCHLLNKMSPKEILKTS